MIYNDGSDHTLTPTSSGGYSFTMPAQNVTVTATWKKLLTITAASDSKAYDGTALTNNDYTSEGLLEGDVIKSITITGSQTNVGNSDNVPSAAVIKNGDTDVTANYAITYVNGTLTVTTASVSYTDGTITRDEHGYSVNLTEGGESTGSADPLPNNAILHDLTYSRTLTAPGSDKGEVQIDGEQYNLYTVCLPFAPATGENVRYYTLSGISGETVSFEEVTTTPAANTPYLVAVTGDTDFTENRTNEEVTPAPINSTSVGGYTFTGTFTGMTNAEAQGKYILQANNKWGKVTAGNSGAYIPPFRAYIEGGSGARMLTGHFGDDTTGLQYIRTTDADGTEQWYDLQGRRIERPTQKGMYIHNGRKEVRK